MSTKIFFDSRGEFFLDKVEYSFNDKDPKGSVKIDIEDSVGVEKSGENVKIIVVRKITDQQNIINVVARGYEYRTLKDKALSEKDILEYLKKNPEELNLGFSQLSIVIANNTIMTPFRGMVTPNQFIFNDK